MPKSDISIRPLEWVPTQGGFWLRAENACGAWEVRAADPDKDAKIALAEAEYGRRVRSLLNGSPEGDADVVHEDVGVAHKP